MPLSRRALAALAAAALAGCAGPPPAAEPARPATLAIAGDEGFVRPLDGLTADQLAAFRRGRTLYERSFTPGDGLGPLYNNVSCKACHGLPGTGGGSAEQVTLVAGAFNGAAQTLREDGGPVISDHAVQGIPPEQVPLDATAISRRISPPTFGAGLIEAIPVKALTAQLAADPARQALGIRGRANWDFTQIGRFGWKAQTGDMVAFTVNAANFEMGLSSPQRPHEFFPNRWPQLLEAPRDLATDPVVGTWFGLRGPAWQVPDLTAEQVADLAAFQRFQAPPVPAPASEQARAGEAAFHGVGCAACHTPAFTTGPNALGVPVGQPVPLWSDLLLHDMGEDGADGIRWQGRAGSADWRTPPLWGLRYRQRLLHDGRAATLEDAIAAHGGEGRQVAEAYARLDEPARAALKAFLLTL